MEYFANDPQLEYLLQPVLFCFLMIIADLIIA